MKEFDGNYSLLSPFVCDAISTKEDRRIRHARQSGSNFDDTNDITDMSIDFSSNSSTGLIPNHSVISIRLYIFSSIFFLGEISSVFILLD